MPRARPREPARARCRPRASWDGGEQRREADQSHRCGIDVGLSSRDWSSTSQSASLQGAVMPAEKSGGAAKRKRDQCCEVEAAAREFLGTLDISSVYFDPEFDRCYCDRCYEGSWPDTIVEEGPTPYVVPRGWFRFGLALQPRARDETLDIFRKWSVSFHGTKAPLVLKSILQCGSLMKSGDKLLQPHPKQRGCRKEGCRKLHSTKCAGRQDKVFYTSPSIKYAGLKFYAEPQQVNDRLHASMALQCRQEPGSFETQAETMEFAEKMRGHLRRECPHVNLDEIEWKSDANASAIPYGLLIRTVELGQDAAYQSPLDEEWGPRPMPSLDRASPAGLPQCSQQRASGSDCISGRHRGSKCDAGS